MEERRTTSGVNGRLWGTAAQNWAAIQEGTSRPVYQAVFDRVGLKVDERYLDAGCGAGLAAQMAAARGAQVYGLDAPKISWPLHGPGCRVGSFTLANWRVCRFPTGSSTW